MHIYYVNVYVNKVLNTSLKYLMNLFPFHDIRKCLASPFPYKVIFIQIVHISVHMLVG